MITIKVVSGFTSLIGKKPVESTASLDVVALGIHHTDLKRIIERSTNPTIVYKRSAVRVSSDIAVKLDGINLDLGKYPCPTRKDVAEAIRSFGLAAYIGGNHVAVHRSNQNGEITGSQIAMFTGNFGDWI